ncbi:MAG: non-homologous end-joining DNA ligase [Methanobacteriota archaeon]
MRTIRPMLATPSVPIGDDPRFGFEYKWDGVRAILSLARGRLRIRSRTARDVTARYPELLPFAESFPRGEGVLDGEIVAPGEDGRPDFGRLQRRMHLEGHPKVLARAKEVPVVYLVFDLLSLDGRSLLSAPYWERRAILDDLALAGPAWGTPPAHVGEGEAMFAASARSGLEGIVAKRLDSPYRPGVRTRDWLKIKNRLRQEFVIGGFTRGTGARGGRVGALLLGFYDGGRLRYAGRVGSGFSDETLRVLEWMLRPILRAESPFSDRVEGEAWFVEPLFVAEVDAAGWTHNRTLRQASFVGLRPDKEPSEVELEVPVVPGAS